jgi:methionyl aminopeptidase
MSITSQAELSGIKKISEVVGLTLKLMREQAAPGMSTYELDQFGAMILNQYGARSAPNMMYGFPGTTCISVNHEVAHGIPAKHKVLKEGDLVNIDVSAELNGFFADNGGSFVLGKDTQNLQPLIDSSMECLKVALSAIKGGERISDIGGLIQKRAKSRGFRVIKNLVGHGIGRALHEDPKEIPCFPDPFNTKRFRKNTVVAVETFISTKSSYAMESGDGWTYVGKDGGFVAQHEHTIIVTDSYPVILTEANGILS